MDERPKSANVLIGAYWGIIASLLPTGYRTETIGESALLGERCRSLEWVPSAKKGRRYVQRGNEKETSREPVQCSAVGPNLSDE